MKIYSIHLGEGSFKYAFSPERLLNDAKFTYNRQVSIKPTKTKLCLYSIDIKGDVCFYSPYDQKWDIEATYDVNTNSWIF